MREVVPGKSNNELVLVLQYYDYNVENAIQAYVEGKVCGFFFLSLFKAVKCYYSGLPNANYCPNKSTAMQKIRNR